MTELSTVRDSEAAEPLSETLARLFAGRREENLTLGAFLDGLQGRAYPFAVAALNLPNCVPTGIPWLSTITGIPIVLLLIQQALRLPAPSLPPFISRRSLPRGKLQDFYPKAQRPLQWLERRIRARLQWLLDEIPGILLGAALFLNAVILALPIPFNNLIPAWAIMFFAMAQLERDGAVALLGWLTSLGTAVWTVVLLTAYGHAGSLGFGFLRRFIDSLTG